MNKVHFSQLQIKKPDGRQKTLKEDNLLLSDNSSFSPSPLNKKFSSPRSFNENILKKSQSFRWKSLDFKHEFYFESPRAVTLQKSIVLKNWKSQVQLFQDSEKRKFNLTPIKLKNKKLMSEHAFHNDEIYRDIMQATNSKTKLSVEKYFAQTEEVKQQEFQIINKNLKGKEKHFQYWTQKHSSEHSQWEILKALKHTFK